MQVILSHTNTSFASDELQLARVSTCSICKQRQRIINQHCEGTNITYPQMHPYLNCATCTSLSQRCATQQCVLSIASEVNFRNAAQMAAWKLYAHGWFTYLAFEACVIIVISNVLSSALIFDDGGDGYATRGWMQKAVNGVVIGIDSAADHRKCVIWASCICK